MVSLTAIRQDSLCLELLLDEVKTPTMLAVIMLFLEYV